MVEVEGHGLSPHLCCEGVGVPLLQDQGGLVVWGSARLRGLPAGTLASTQMLWTGAVRDSVCLRP